MKLHLRPRGAVLFFLLVILFGGRPGAAVAAAPLLAQPVSLFTAFDEGRADGRAYRISVQHEFNRTDLIAQQVQASQSAAAAEPSNASYFQGYVAGLQLDSTLANR